MIFTEPVEFAEAIASRGIKRVMPTHLGSAELQQLSREVRDYAHFSARTANVTLLERQHNIISQLLRPRPQQPGVEVIADRATARAALKDALRRIGYDPSDDPSQPRPGSLADLSSDARIDLIIRTNTEIAFGAGKHAADQEPSRLAAWPAQELVRFEARREERDWVTRWQNAGRAAASYGMGWGIFDGRMIAVKNHPIWDSLGDPNLFEDGLGNPYPPYAFNSGMWTQDVGREEAIELGVIDPDDPTPPPQEVAFRSPE